MTIGSVFWFLAGAMTAAVATLLAIPWLRQAAAGTGSLARRVAILAGSIVVLSAAALFVYSRTGSPNLLDATGTPPHAAAPAPGMSAAAAGAAAATGRADSMEVAAARLAQKLARGTGSEADWTLLAQSYEFMGRAADAALARAHKLPDGATAAAEAGAVATGTGSTPDARAAPGPPGADSAELEARVARSPRDGAAWLALAQARRAAREANGALEAYERAAALGAMTADGWADYADVLASVSGGKLAGRPAEAVRRALAIDPRHPKALWLDASLALELHDYRSALERWRRLRSVLPAGSPDLSAVDSNILESEELAGLKPSAIPAALAPPPGPGAAAAAGDVRVAGTVQLAPALASRVTRGMVLFVYAKSPDSPGPPLAVMRTVVDRWPVRFALDDSMAMMPARRLSAFDPVVIEARISRSGNAIAAPGDLIATSPAVHPRDGHPVALTISREIS